MTDLEQMQPGKKSVHLEEPDSGKMLNAAAGKTSSAGRGRRLTEDYDDGFISRQIAETLGTGHRSGGSSGNVAYCNYICQALSSVLYSLLHFYSKFRFPIKQRWQAMLSC